jgi:metal-dependent HD superfamily phosphatase/phosphodiesterase
MGVIEFHQIAHNNYSTKLFETILEKIIGSLLSSWMKLQKGSPIGQ